MSFCTTRIPTSDEGTKWNFPKFYELLHIVDDMIRFGASTNFCAQRPESLLKVAAKNQGDEHKNDMTDQNTNCRQHSGWRIHVVW